MHWTEIAERRAGDTLVLVLKGHLTLSEEQHSLLRRVRELMDEGNRAFVLNLRHASHIDSSGIGEIVGSYIRVARAGGTLRICEASPRVMGVLQATTLDTVLELFEREEDALAIE